MFSPANPFRVQEILTALIDNMNVLLEYTDHLQGGRAHSKQFGRNVVDIYFGGGRTGWPCTLLVQK